MIAGFKFLFILLAFFFSVLILAFDEEFRDLEGPSDFNINQDDIFQRLVEAGIDPGMIHISSDSIPLDQESGFPIDGEESEETEEVYVSVDDLLKAQSVLVEIDSSADVNSIDTQRIDSIDDEWLHETVASFVGSSERAADLVSKATIEQHSNHISVPGVIRSHQDDGRSDGKLRFRFATPSTDDDYIRQLSVSDVIVPITGDMDTVSTDKDSKESLTHHSVTITPGVKSGGGGGGGGVITPSVEGGISVSYTISDGQILEQKQSQPARNQPLSDTADSENENEFMAAATEKDTRIIAAATEKDARIIAPAVAIDDHKSAGLLTDNEKDSILVPQMQSLDTEYAHTIDTNKVKDLDQQQQQLIELQDKLGALEIERDSLKIALETALTALETSLRNATLLDTRARLAKNEKNMAQLTLENCKLHGELSHQEHSEHVQELMLQLMDYKAKVAATEGTVTGSNKVCSTACLSSVQCTGVAEVSRGYSNWIQNIKIVRSICSCNHLIVFVVVVVVVAVVAVAVVVVVVVLLLSCCC